MPGRSVAFPDVIYWVARYTWRGVASVVDLMTFFAGKCDIQVLSVKGMLRRNIEHFLKKTLRGKIKNFWNEITEKCFFLFPTVCIFGFVKIWTPVFTSYFLVDKSVTSIMNMRFENYDFRNLLLNDLMSDLYFNEESDYSEQNTNDNEVFRSIIL